MHIIARMKSDFKEKFGIPRQSGLVPQLTSRIVFEKEYRSSDALRGIEGFSHLWLIWEFSEAKRDTWSPTVRPPRLGGNTRMGVFATRSPFRPNPIGLSCVELLRVEWDAPDGPALVVAGADLMDGTPIYDIKPYLPYVDSHPQARGGFGSERAGYALDVVFPGELEALIPQEKREGLRGVLAGDPRPSYQDDAQRVYGVAFAGMNVKFMVKDGVLTVTDVQKEE
ncbi:MAG: tRNA (N6-threonylcarbamoyladenosine(37)-N6)-methyltransferase TrmO [Clostridia bacterium]|nr:tRNA (N6-threonylcarbamoyladenosine(37)-N6)-methyltransferase TrmO [Clostridia bacterium]